MTEKNYIRYRKLKAMGNRICFYVCRIFPIKKKRISICTFEGKGGFGCNPKYVVEKLHEQDPELEFVWFVDDLNKEFPSYIRKVSNTFWSRAFWLSTSKVWLDNYRKPYGTCKRKKQYYINTNHYTIGFKSTGLWRGKAFSQMAYLVSKNDSDMIDGLLIDSRWCEDTYYKSLVYEGEYWKTGSPRCDVLYGDRGEWREAFHRKHHIEGVGKVVMFAPTFREGAKNGVRSVFSEVWTIDFKRLINALENRFGGTWYICVRVHPQLAPTFQEYRNAEIQDRLIDVSQEDDMYEILAGIDAYITDYSSAAFEAGFAEIPVFLYADDIEKYAHDRGSLMWNLVANYGESVRNNKRMTPNIDVELPYMIARNNEELEKNILNFDMTDYKRKIECLKKEVQLIFDGQASRRVADKIEEIINIV